MVLLEATKKIRRLNKSQRHILTVWMQATLSQRERIILEELGYTGTDEMIDALVKYRKGFWDKQPKSNEIDKT